MRRASLFFCVALAAPAQDWSSLEAVAREELRATHKYLHRNGRTFRKQP